MLQTAKEHRMAMKSLSQPARLSELPLQPLRPLNLPQQLPQPEEILQPTAAVQLQQGVSAGLRQLTLQPLTVKPVTEQEQAVSQAALRDYFPVQNITSGHMLQMVQVQLMVLI